MKDLRKRTAVDRLCMDPPPGDVEVAVGQPNYTWPGSRDFDEFYARELPVQLRRATLLLGSDTLAADVVHDAFLAIYNRWHAIDEPGAYLNRSVVNGCRSAGRRTARRLRALSRMDLPSGDPDNDVLWDVLSHLPANQRAAVVLRYYAGMTEAEIADALGCRQGSVGPWISRALAAMRKELS